MEKEPVAIDRLLTNSGESKKAFPVSIDRLSTDPLTGVLHKLTPSGIQAIYAE